MKIKFKKIHEDAVLPKYASDGDAGMDLVTVTDAKIKDKYIEYKFGLAVEIPDGHVGLIFPRSSISKTDLSLCNSVGVIDSKYRGEIAARFDYDISNTCYEPARLEKYKKGDRIAQLIVMPYPKIETEWSDELTETIRGNGGFGSTGK